MSCMFCTHWKEPEFKWGSKESIDEWENRTGECTLYPEWIETHAQHYCGQQMLKKDGLMVEWRKRMSDAGVARNEWQQRAKKAEAAAKDLRAKLKAAKSQQPVE